MSKASDKVKNFVENKKENFILSVQNSSALGIVIKWLITNKVSVILFLVVCMYAGRYYYLEYEYLKERNKILIEERDNFLNKTKQLEGKILQLKESIEKSKELNRKVRENAKILDSDQKKKVIEDLVERLKDKRGIY
jgi:uncharacterized membrane protein YhiD involved in acid resistance